MPVVNLNDPPGHVSFRCPGCGRIHSLPIRSGDGSPRPSWEFHGDAERPTLAPSILATWQWGREQTKHICHSFVREGMIEFLSDCTHAHAGQTMALPPLREPQGMIDDDD